MKGQRIKKILKERGLTIVWLSKKVGITPVAMSHIVSGDAVPYLDTAYRISLVLDIPLEELFFKRVARAIKDGKATVDRD